MPDKETYHWLKDHHICTVCGSEDAEPHKTKCAECAAKEAVRRKKYWARLDKETREKAIRGGVARQRSLKTQGRCVCCGRRAAKGHVRCTECLIKTRRRNKKQYDAKRVKTNFAEGLCSRCNEPALTGKKLCAKHYDIARRSMENVNRLNQERRATANHVWRGDNRVVFQKKKKPAAAGTATSQTRKTYR